MTTIASFTLVIFGRSTMKSMLMSSQGLVGTKRSVKALMKVTLSYVINVASYDHLMNVPTNLGPIKILLDYLKGLVNAKVVR